VIPATSLHKSPSASFQIADLVLQAESGRAEAIFDNPQNERSKLFLSQILH
jgi:hypothetical protein